MDNFYSNIYFTQKLANNILGSGLKGKYLQNIELKNGQFHRGHHSLEYLVTVPSFTDILNILSIAAGVYILQKYEYYSPAIIKGTIILPYVHKFLRAFGMQFPALNTFF